MTKEQKIRLALFLVIASGLFVVILGVLLVPKLKEEGDTYLINFKDTSVNGLYQGAPVKYQGVEIGRVNLVRVNRSDLNSIFVHIRLRKGFPVKSDMKATLMYAGITGQKFVELSGGRNESANLNPGGEIPTGRGLGEQAEDIVANIDAAVVAINSLLSEDNQRKLSLLLENSEKTSAILHSVLAERKTSLENSLANIDRASQRFSEVTENLFLVLENLRLISARIEQDTTKTFSNISERFSGDEIGKLVENLEVFIASMTDSVKRIQSTLIRQQTEMNQTFDDFREVMQNMSKLSRDLAEDPTILIRSRKGKGK